MGYVSDGRWQCESAYGYLRRHDEQWLFDGYSANGTGYAYRCEGIFEMNLCKYAINSELQALYADGEANTP